MTADLDPEGAVNSKRPRRRRTILFWLVLMTSVLVLFVGYRLATLPDLRPPFDVASFESVSIPEDQNDFTYYRQAKDRFVEASAVVPDVKAQPALWIKLEDAIRNGWSKADEPVQKWLQLNQPRLEVWRRGSECPDGIETPLGRERSEPILPVSQSLRKFRSSASCRRHASPRNSRPPRRGLGIGPFSARVVMSAGMLTRSVG